MVSISRDISKATKFWLLLIFHIPVSKWMQLAVNWEEHVLLTPLPSSPVSCKMSQTESFLFLIQIFLCNSNLSLVPLKTLAKLFFETHRERLVAYLWAGNPASSFLPVQMGFQNYMAESPEGEKDFQCSKSCRKFSYFVLQEPVIKGRD